MAGPGPAEGGGNVGKELLALRAEVAELRRRCEATEEREERALRRLAANSRALWVPHTVPRLPVGSLSPLEFARDYVAASQPVVFTGLDPDEWPCLRRWSDEHLLQAAGEAEVSVNVTPGGFGDYVDEEGRFVKPVEERLLFRDFWAWLHSADAAGRPGVPYLSQQNDSLRQELPTLIEDVPSAVPLGCAAFGNEPEAINLWIGDDRAVSSCHKDHYENLYTVVRGEKVFTLLPPAAVPFLQEQRCPAARFRRRSAEKGATADAGASGEQHFEVVLDGDAAEVPWVPVDVAAPDLRRFPGFAQAAKLVREVRVGAGEMLYLPAMWYHRVAQRGLTIAVNYWHDMPFGHAFVHHHFLRDVVGLYAADDQDHEEEEDDDEGP